MNTILGIIILVSWVSIPIGQIIVLIQTCKHEKKNSY